jgi:hypothetical protein
MENKIRVEMRPQDWAKEHLRKNKNHKIDDLYWGLNFAGCFKCNLHHVVGWGLLTKFSTD